MPDRDIVLAKTGAGILSHFKFVKKKGNYSGLPLWKRGTKGDFI